MAYVGTPSLGGILEAHGLNEEERSALHRLLSLWDAKLANNRLRRDFYYMHIAVENIGISVDDDMAKRIKASCNWPKLAVNKLAERSITDGFVMDSGEHSKDLDRILLDNRFDSKYLMAVKSELMHSLVCWTVSRADVGRSKVRIKTHSAETSAVEWDGGEERVADGIAIVDTRPLAPTNPMTVPSVLNLYLADRTITLMLMDDNTHWSAHWANNPMGRPLIEPMCFEPTPVRPFGQSRIDRAVMCLTMSKLREDMRAEIAAEFAATPQKWLMGADDEAFDMDRYKAYMGNIFMASKDEDGDTPTFGQLPQISMQPHVDYKRDLAAEFAGATCIPISSLGIIHDNPSSAQAMVNAERDMVQLAEGMNKVNGEALRNVALMALAIDRGAGVTLDKLTDEEYTLQADWHDPSMPNIAATADAWQKIATVQGAEWIASTEEFLEGVGIPETKRRRMLNQRRRIQGRSFLMEGNGNDTEGRAGEVLKGAGPNEGSRETERVDGVADLSQGSGGIVA